MHRQLITQIRGTEASQTKMTALGSQLRDLDVRVTPTSPDATFARNITQAGWAKYEDQLNLYDAIARSSFHLVLNEGALNRETLLEVLYAMSKGKPVVFSHPPSFDATVTPFMSEVLDARLKQIKVGDLTSLELAELSYLINGLPQTIDYHFSDHETALVRSLIKAHFRKLLENAKQQSDAA